MKQERFPHPGNALHQLGDQSGQKGSIGTSKERTAIGLWQAKQRDQYRRSDHHTALPSLSHASAVTCRG